jgi:hypothetical protein
VQRWSVDEEGCGELKPSTAFRLLRQGSFNSYCNEYQRQATREWRAENREAILARWRDLHGADIDVSLLLSHLSPASRSGRLSESRRSRETTLQHAVNLTPVGTSPLVVVRAGPGLANPRWIAARGARLLRPIRFQGSAAAKADPQGGPTPGMSR